MFVLTQEAVIQLGDDFILLFFVVLFYFVTFEDKIVKLYCWISYVIIVTLGKPPNFTENF